MLLVWKTCMSQTKSLRWSKSGKVRKGCVLLEILIKLGTQIFFNKNATKITINLNKAETLAWMYAALS